MVEGRIVALESDLPWFDLMFSDVLFSDLLLFETEEKGEISGEFVPFALDVEEEEEEMEEKGEPLDVRPKRRSQAVWSVVLVVVVVLALVEEGGYR